MLGIGQNWFSNVDSIEIEEVSFVVEMAQISTLLFLSVFLLLFCGCFCDFPTDFLGNYVSDDEYNNRTLCWTPVCMRDSDRLINDADHNSNDTLPCEDFKKFAMGNFFKNRVADDPYSKAGFDADVEKLFFEKQKKMLLKPAEEKDPMIFKFIKRYFCLCINSSENFL